jgi:hypothetical protein
LIRGWIDAAQDLVIPAKAGIQTNKQSRRICDDAFSALGPGLRRDDA